MKRVSPACALLLLFLSSTALSGATHSLTLHSNGNGIITANPAASAYPHNSTVTLTATPSSGWQFSGWSGDISGTMNPTNVLMDADKVITAIFSQIPIYSLTVQVSGGGSMAPLGGSYLSNTVVELTATASNGWTFHHWSGDASGSANPLSLTMSRNKSVEAVFIQPVNITRQPESATAPPGGVATFSVAADGTGPLSYEWLFGGAALPGANAPTLTLVNVPLASAGNYQAVVAGPYNSVTSSVATLTVLCSGTNVVSVATDAALRSAVAIGGNVRLCFSGTLVLTNTISVTTDTWLDAAGVSVTISGNNARRLFDVSSGVTFGLAHLTLTAGAVTGTASNTSGGAAIFSDHGHVALESCVLSNHRATNCWGGAVMCRGGSLFATDCQFINNGIRGTISTSANSAFGGAIYGGSALIQITDSLFLSNSVASDSAVGGFENAAQLRGGALALALGTGVFSRVVFATNQALGAFSRNGVLPTVHGGALCNRGALWASDCTFQGNAANANSGNTLNGAAAYGGAIETIEAVLIGCTFADNTVRGGPGRNGVGTFPGTPGWGGAVHNSGMLSATNCTFTRNVAMGGADGSFGSGATGYGGAVSSAAGSVFLMNVTLAGNATRIGLSGLNSFGMNVFTTNATFTLRNSLLSGTSNNVAGPIIDGGYNMSSDGTANFNSGTSFNFTDPRLLPLASNGGLTPTMELASDSPAKDWAPLTDAPATDQRGFPRPYGSGVDLGAYEAWPGVPPLSVARGGDSVSISFSGQAGVKYRLEQSLDLRTWQSGETIGPLNADEVVTRRYPTIGSCRFYRLALAF